MIAQPQQPAIFRVAFLLTLLLMAATLNGPRVWSQVPADPVAEGTETNPDAVAPGVTNDDDASGLKFFELLLMGRYWMLPILLMSLLVGTFSFERLIGLRTSRILPRRLTAKLRKMASGETPFDPRDVYHICDAHPSAVARIVQAMLAKIGRPHAEVEQAMREASEREAARMHAHVRWLNLAAAVTPLMGLLGTVWGLIRAFHDTTQLAAGQNKADHLAAGIYVALVTTLAGLAVAIPAAILAHYFEGRIQNSLLKIEELLVSLMPHVEKFEGRSRFRAAADPNGDTHSARVEPPPVQTPPPTTHELSGS